MLSVRDLVKVYPGPVTALQGVQLDLAAGMFGLLGPNGAGKSTFMRILAGLLEPTSGSVTLDGEDILARPQAVRARLGYLPQEFGFYPHLSGEQMLLHLLRLKGVSAPGGLKRLARELLERVNLSFAARRPVKGYSGGMRQRLGIAQAIAGDPRLVIVDEPTAGLDPTERHRFLNLLGEIGQDIVVILSTHIVEDVRELCNAMAIINRGEVVLAGDPSTIVNSVEGKLWRKSVSKADLPAHEAKYNIVSVRLQAGRPLVHIYSETDPGDGFTMIEPDLEDVYFREIGRGSTAAAA